MNPSPSDAAVTPRCPGGFGNFRNPFGLVMRMLRSGDRAAIEALFREAFRIGLAPVDKLLQWSERRATRNTVKSSLPIVLVVGAPRSGTTLIYQTLARYCKVSYFTNLSSLFPRSPLTASRLFRQIRPQAPKRFRSYYGQTAGLAGSNDAFHIWNRWLGEDRYSVPSELTAGVVSEMRVFFDAWRTSAGLPVLNKNNRNAVGMSLLASALPDAYFIVVRRDPLMAAQSIIQARRMIQGDQRFGWGLRSRDSVLSDDPLGYVNDVCEQLLTIERETCAELAKIDGDRVVECSYEAFCKTPSPFLESVAESVPGLELRGIRIEKELHSFHASKTLRLTPEERQRANRLLQSSRTTAPEPVNA